MVNKAEDTTFLCTVALQFLPEDTKPDPACSNGYAASTGLATTRGALKMPEVGNMQARPRLFHVFGLTLICIMALFITLSVNAQQSSSANQKAEIDRLREAVVKNPNSANLRIALANALDDSGDSESAIAEYREAIRLEPGNAGAHRNLGITYIRKGEWEAAVAALREAVRSQPDYLVAHCDLADVFVHTNDLEQAFREYRQATLLDRAGVARLRQFDDYPEVLQELEKASPDAVAHLLVGVTLRNLGQSDAAIKEFHKAIELDRKFALAYMLMAQVYLRTNRSEMGWDNLQQATHLNPELLHVLEEEGWIKGKKSLEAERKKVEAERKKDLEDEVAAIQEQLDVMSGVVADPAKARQAGLDKKVAEMLSFLADKYYEAGDFDKGVETIKKAIALRPSDKHYQERLKKFEQAKQANP